MHVPLVAIGVLVLMTSSKASANTHACATDRSRVVVQMVHRCSPGKPCLTPTTLTAVRNETAGIWSRMGVSIEWAAFPRNADASAVAVDLRVILDEVAPPLSAAEGADDHLILAALAHAGSPCGTSTARLWTRAVREFAASARVHDRRLKDLPAALGERAVARAIGRALAHEIGHYLLGTADHAAHGLMRQVFQPQEMIGPVTDDRYTLTQPAATLARQPRATRGH